VRLLLEQNVDIESFAARQEMLKNALIIMEDALRLLDEADCPADVGAHLDLAICRLRDGLQECSTDLDIARTFPAARMAK
jgi:hypothetical protein